jgi:hypothetical protein
MSSHQNCLLENPLREKSAFHSRSRTFNLTFSGPLPESRKPKKDSRSQHLWLDLDYLRLLQMKNQSYAIFARMILYQEL